MLMTKPRQSSTADVFWGICLRKSHLLNVFHRRGRALRLAALCAALLPAVPAVLGAPPREDTPALIAAEKVYDTARACYQTNAADALTALHFARACFDRADLASSDADRAAAAREGIKVCRRLLARAPDLAAAHYYLAMNLGQLARTKKLRALSLVKEMEREWESARALDEHFDFAGPDRNLGLLLRDAPAFPVSIGSRLKAQQHMQRAVELNPDYPENYLNLIETQLQHKQWDEAAAEDKKLRAILPAARQKFSGPQWQDAWEDWDKRQQKILARLPAAP
jgi:tetratricopeptide (TPR) repeat protein